MKVDNTRIAEVLSELGAWTRIPFLDIKKGMVFRMFEDDGTPVVHEGTQNTDFTAAEDAYEAESGLQIVAIADINVSVVRQFLNKDVPSTNICIYHSRDYDGKCSAAIVKMFLEGLGEAVTLFGIDYGETFPEDLVVAGITKVILVDFSMPPELMYSLNNCCAEVGAKFIWIDHHGTAISAVDAYAKENSLEELKGLRLVGTAGCELTWDYFYPNLPRPEIVTLLGRYDVWDLSREDWESRLLPFQWGMKASNYRPLEEYPFWKLMLYPGDKSLSDCSEVSRNLSDLLRIGVPILAYQAEQDRWYLEKYGYEVKLLIKPVAKNGRKTKAVHELKAIALNTGIKSSQSFLSVHSEYDIFIAYVHLDTGLYSVSIYSLKKDIDVSKIAVAHKGGGHPGASGFMCKYLPFI